MILPLTLFPPLYQLSISLMPEKIQRNTIKRKDMEQITYIHNPVDQEGIELTSQLKQPREDIAENAHELWTDDRIKESWSYGTERDYMLKKHQYLIPYSKLPDGENQYD